MARDCWKCNGTGIISDTYNHSSRSISCDRCNGTGFIENVTFENEPKIHIVKAIFVAIVYILISIFIFKTSNFQSFINVMSGQNGENSLFMTIMSVYGLLGWLCGLVLLLCYFII